MTIKAGRPLVRLAKLCYQANVPLLLEGSHGVGKSELLQEAARELGIDSLVLDLSLMEPTDLVGLPRMESERTVFCPPTFLPDGGKGFLVFEELNRAQAYMRAPCLQLLTARRLNDYSLPAGWLPVAAVNPPEGGNEVSELDPPLLSRFVRARAVADRDEWLPWARRRKVHPDVRAYVQADPSVFEAPESNPRAWKYTSDLLFAADGEGGQDMLQVAVSGLVGAERAASFFQFRRDRVRPLTAEEVLDKYPQHRDEVLEWVDAGHLDLVRGTLWAVQTRLQSRTNFDEVRGDTGNWKNLALFLKDLPGDLREEAEQFFQDHGYPLPKRRKKT